MAFAWDTLDQKKKTILILAITGIALTLGVIIYEILSMAGDRSEIQWHYIPIWDSNPQVNYGFIWKKETDGTNPNLYPLFFPVLTTDPHDIKPKAYPATYCKECAKPFAFIIQKYEPGMKPDTCPLCGNTDQESLIVLEKAEQILDYDLRESFDLFWDDSHLKNLDWTDENGKRLSLFDYWLELQKKKGIDLENTDGNSSETE